MKFFFPDSCDYVDPSFDFRIEKGSSTRVPQRDDLYAHEIYDVPPYDGILVSKAIVEQPKKKKFTIAQRNRLYNLGVREFYRLDERQQTRHLETMGDCGAFSSQDEDEPLSAVDQVIDYYENCGFDYGISLDLIIKAWDPKCEEGLYGKELIPEIYLTRQRKTLELAKDFITRHRQRGCKFRPVGVAQGWSRSSYAESVIALQDLGYSMIAIGGMAGKKPPPIEEALEEVYKVRNPGVDIHILGVDASKNAATVQQLGVTSFDSTSPLMRGLKGQRDNYHTRDRTYMAVRVPQVDGNDDVRAAIRSGAIDQNEAIRLETNCMKALLGFNEGVVAMEKVLSHLSAYEQLLGIKKSRIESYRETLTDKPWKMCPCKICRDLEIHVVIFRGQQRNRRRGFHNVYMVGQRLRENTSTLHEIP